eukprot:2654219-Rhodomonas_salina.2
MLSVTLAVVPSVVVAPFHAPTSASVVTVRAFMASGRCREVAGTAAGEQGSILESPYAVAMRRPVLAVIALRVRYAMTCASDYSPTRSLRSFRHREIGVTVHGGRGMLMQAKVT